MTRTLRPLAALAIVAIVTVISAGCGGAGADTAASETAAAARTTATVSTGRGTGLTARDKAVKFSECMRQNGVGDFPDPDASGAFPSFGVSFPDPYRRRCLDRRERNVAGLRRNEQVLCECESTRRWDVCGDKDDKVAPPIALDAVDGGTRGADIRCGEFAQPRLSCGEPCGRALSGNGLPSSLTPTLHVRRVASPSLLDFSVSGRTGMDRYDAVLFMGGSTTTRRRRFGTLDLSLSAPTCSGSWAVPDVTQQMLATALRVTPRAKLYL